MFWPALHPSTRTRALGFPVASSRSVSILRNQSGHSLCPCGNLEQTSFACPAILIERRY
jgi:hypothetical protein